jgi:hypothetical protein
VERQDLRFSSGNPTSERAPSRKPAWSSFSIGVSGFEPETFGSQSRRATQRRFKAAPHPAISLFRQNKNTRNPGLGGTLPQLLCLIRHSAHGQTSLRVSNEKKPVSWPSLQTN